MSSREDMRRMLEQAKKAINARKADPAAAATHEASNKRSHRHHHNRRESGEALAHTTSIEPSPTSSTVNEIDPRENKRAFLDSYFPLVKKFVLDRTKLTLEVPDVTNYGRVLLHTLADKCNLSHTSTGERSRRVLQLKKDVLFFQHEDAIHHVNLDDIVAQSEKKESRYHLRHVRAADPTQLAQGELGSYDEDAWRKIERLRRATDEYRYATEIGYTQEEMLAMEDGKSGEKSGEGTAASPPGPPERIEDILRRRDDNDGESAEAYGGHASRIRLGTEPTGTAVGHSPSSGATGSSIGDGVREYSERCHGCGTVARVDYSVSGWSCSKYCAQCTRQTIWSLEERSTAVEPLGSSNRMKRGRKQEPAVATGESTPLEIDLEEDTPITTEDFVDMAAMNDFSADDLNWLRTFAQRHEPRVHAAGAFCIDFKDLRDLRVFRSYEAAASAHAAEAELGPAPKYPTHESGGRRTEAHAAPLYVVLQNSPQEGVSLASLLRELLAVAFAGTGAVTVDRSAEVIAKEVDTATAMEHVALAFLNVSVYGSTTTAICQLRPHVPTSAQPSLEIQANAVEALATRHGAARVRVVDNLDSAIAAASGEWAP